MPPRFHVMRKRARSQPRIPGLTRVPIGACVDPRIQAKIESLAERHKVSKSWVMAVLYAKALDIDIPEY